MTAIGRMLGAITLFVDDPRRSQAFYGNVFDLEPIFQDAVSAAFQLDNVVLNLLARSAAPDLITPAPVARPGGDAQAQMTIAVDDVDAACAELAARGVTLLNGPIDRPWGVRTAAFADPDGHVWELAADLPRA